MTKLPARWIRAALAAVLACAPACAARTEPATSASVKAPRPSTCADVAAALESRGPSLGGLIEPSTTAAPSNDDEVAAIAGSCTADAWAPITRQCLVDAQAAADLASCGQAITRDQRAHLQARVELPADLKAAAALSDQMCSCATAACAIEVDAHAQQWQRALTERYLDPQHALEALRPTLLEIAGCEARVTVPHERFRVPEPPAPPYVARYPDHGSVNWAKQLKGRASEGRTCDRMVVLQARYLACAKLPLQARKDMLEIRDQQQQAWDMMQGPDVSGDMKAAADEGCAEGTDKLIDSAKAAGCEISPDR